MARWPSWLRRPWSAVRGRPSKSVGRRRSYRAPRSCACRLSCRRRRRATRVRASTEFARAACTGAGCWSTSSSGKPRSPLHTHTRARELFRSRRLESRLERFGYIWHAMQTNTWSCHNKLYRCVSGCVVECRICNREVAGSNLGLGYFAPRSTQPSIPLRSVNEYQLRLGRQRQVWLIPIADERVGVQVKLWNPLRTRAIPERFCGDDSLQRGAISSVCTFTFARVTAPVVTTHHLRHPCPNKVQNGDILMPGYRGKMSVVCCISCLIHNDVWQGMDLIESLNHVGFNAYLKQYHNTICGRHPIGVLLAVSPVAVITNVISIHNGCGWYILCCLTGLQTTCFIVWPIRITCMIMETYHS